MEAIQVQTLRDRPELSEQAAAWFHSKWGVPLEAYRESIRACVQGAGAVPQWYVVCSGTGQIVAGAGVIENDFHDRQDLWPNLCALFVEEPWRSRGIARELLDFARRDLGRRGIGRLYLVTDHTEFYEKCGWSFLTMVHDSEGNPERMYTAETLEK